MANFQYPQAGRNAPPGVRQSIDLFRRIPADRKRNLPLLYFLLGDGTPPYKMDPVDANYVPQSQVPNQKCGNCVRAFQQVTTKRFICDQIRGTIAPEAWCRLWKG